MNVLTFSFPLKIFVLGYENNNGCFWLTTTPLSAANSRTANATVFTDLLTTDYIFCEMLGKNYAHRQQAKITSDKKTISWFDSESQVWQYNISLKTYLYFGLG